MFKRFIKYSLIGCLTFLFDLLLLYVSVDVLHINYLLSVFCAFLIAVSVNYFLSRKEVFVGSGRGPVLGYLYFLTIISGGVVIMLGLMYLLVEIFQMDIFVARVSVAGLVGIFNFLMNDRFNFKMKT